jgi:hypothetical protein
MAPLSRCRADSCRAGSRLRDHAGTISCRRAAIKYRKYHPKPPSLDPFPLLCATRAPYRSLEHERAVNWDLHNRKERPELPLVPGMQPSHQHHQWNRHADRERRKKIREAQNLGISVVLFGMVADRVDIGSSTSTYSESLSKLREVFRVPTASAACRCCIVRFSFLCVCARLDGAMEPFEHSCLTNVVNSLASSLSTLVASLRLRFRASR